MNYKHLKIFGCLAYGRIKQGKLDARAIKRVFISYPDSVKDYKISSVEGHECLITRDVQFNKAIMINKSNIATYVLTSLLKRRNRK